MTLKIFVVLLYAFSTISGLFTEGIKNIIKDKKNVSYNILAICVSLIVGCAGTAVYYQLNEIVFSINNIIYMVLMGFSSALASMIGYDKVKQTILQLSNKKEEVIENESKNESN